MKKAVLILFAAILMAKLLVPCTIVAAGKKATRDGSVIVSHTDCGADSRLRVVLGQKYPKGAMANVYYGIQEVRRPLNDHGRVLGQIPQVPRTYTYFHSAYSHINEHQLAIGESTTSQRPELEVDVDSGKQIMTVEQAMIFALQRCKEAREALDEITSLMDRYGFLPSCQRGSETLAIGDPNEVWILELFSVGPQWDPQSGTGGVIWAAQRLPDAHVTMVPNWSIIKKIDPSDPKRFRVSRNYRSFAIERGWYDPDSGDPFIWQEVYAPVPREWATSRFWLFHTRFAPHLKEWPNRSLADDRLKGYDSYHQYVEPLSLYPFSFCPVRKLGIGEVIRFQRETYPGTIYDKTADLDWLVPDGKGGYRKSPLATPFPTRPWRELLDITHRRNVSKTEYGMIAQLRSWLPDAIGGVYWFYVDNTYSSIHVPVYLGCRKIDPSYRVYDPDRFSEESARWNIDFVDNLLYLRWQDAERDFKSLRDPLQDRFLREQEDIDRQALHLYKKSPLKARQFLTDYTIRNMREVVETYHRIRDLLITKYTNNKQ